ncbi:MAG: alpha/beta hydrolase family protein [Eubacteriales bacterium]
MRSPITAKNLRLFAYENGDLLKGAPRAVVLFFSGLGTSIMHDEPPAEARYYARQGILYVYPYNNPWAWMNRQAIDYTDALTDAVAKRYRLSETIPLIVTGNSMGGLSAMVYALYGKRSPVGCAVNCPVCDLPLFYRSHDFAPRTLHSAFWNEEGDFEEILQSRSPLHLADRLPVMDYHIFQGDSDQRVPRELHADRLVEALTGRGIHCTYDVIPGGTHPSAGCTWSVSLPM